MEAFVMKHCKKHGDRYASDDDGLPEFEVELDDTGYAWLSQISAPWRQRWLDDHDNGRRFQDNEGWDADRINEIRRARKPYGRTRRDRKRFHDEEIE
jgi:hypothetical protein